MARLVTVVILGLLAVISCQKDKYFGPVVSVSGDSLHLESSDVLFIGCEGNFQFNNASLAAFNTTDGTIENDVYLRANDKPLGDVLQSITHRGDSLYLVVNNSGLIRIINDSTYKEIAVFDGLNSPRHMAFIDKNRALVSDYGGAMISLVNFEKMDVETEISTSTWTEGIVVHESMAYIADMSDSAILVLDLNSFQIVSQIEMGIEPKNLFLFDDQVLVSGNGKHGSQLSSISLDHAVFMLFDFSKSIVSSAIEGSTVYFLFNKELISMDLVTSETAIFEHDATTPYSIFIDQNDVFISDVSDYISKGKVLQYNSKLELVRSIETGYIPQSFAR